MNSDNVKKLIVFEDDYFLVSQCGKCDIPGYLIVECKSNATFFSELKNEAQKDFGFIIGKLEFLIKKFVKPENIYILKFSEESKSIHFHMFPRTAKITDEYLKECPKLTGSINGPEIFNWSREKYKVNFGKLSKAVFEILKLIKQNITM